MEEVGVGEIVSFPTPGGDGQGHFAAAAGPGMLLMPGIQGLAPAIVAAAERLASAGVAALMVDLLRGQGRWGDVVEDRDFTHADADRMRTTLCDPGRLEVHTYPGTRRGSWTTPAPIFTTPPPPSWSGSGSGRRRPR